MNRRTRCSQIVWCLLLAGSLSCTPRTARHISSPGKAGPVPQKPDFPPDRQNPPATAETVETPPGTYERIAAELENATGIVDLGELLLKAGLEPEGACAGKIRPLVLRLPAGEPSGGENAMIVGSRAADGNCANPAAGFCLVAAWGENRLQASEIHLDIGNGRLRAHARFFIRPGLWVLGLLDEDVANCREKADPSDCDPENGECGLQGEEEEMDTEHLPARQQFILFSQGRAFVLPAIFATEDVRKKIREVDVDILPADFTRPFAAALWVERTFVWEEKDGLLQKTSCEWVCRLLTPEGKLLPLPAGAETPRNPALQVPCGKRVDVQE